MGNLILSATIIIILAKGLIFTGNTDKTDRDFLIITVFILVLLFGLRNGEVNYGSDLNNYYRLFSRAIEANKFASLYIGSPYEIGYLFLNWIIGRVIKWPQFILFLQASLCIGITMRFIYKHSNDILFSVLAFMSFGLMQFYLTGFRQSIAIAICLIALEMAEKKKLKWFFILIVLASLVHRTAIIFVIAYIFVQIPVNPKTVAIDILMVVVLSRIVPRLMLIGNDMFERNYSSTFIGNSTGGLINIIISVFVLVVMLLGIKHQFENETYIESSDESISITLKNYSVNYKFMHILIIGTTFYALRFQALMLERISLYFTPVLMILLPQVIGNGFTEESKKLLRIVMIFGMLFLIYWRMKGIEYIPMWA